MMCCAVSLTTEETDLEVMTGSSDWHLQKVSFDMGKIFWLFFMTMYNHSHSVACVIKVPSKDLPHYTFLTETTISYEQVSTEK